MESRLPLTPELDVKMVPVSWSLGSHRQAVAPAALVLVLAACGGSFDAKNLDVLGSVELTGRAKAFGLALSGSTVIVKTATGLQTIDWSNASAPKVVTTLDVVPAANSEHGRTARSGSVLYVAHGLRVVAYDVSNPSAPKETAQLYRTGTINDLAVQRDRLFVADQSDGLTSYDLAKPEAPASGSVIAMGPALAVTSDDSIVVAFAANQLQVLKVSGATATKVGQVQSAGMRDLELVGDTVLASVNNGLVAVDVREPAAPRVLGTSTGAATATSGPIRKLGTQVFLASTADGTVRVLDVSDATKAKETSYFRVKNAQGLFSSFVHDVAVDGNRLYLATELGVSLYGTK